MVAHAKVCRLTVLGIGVLSWGAAMAGELLVTGVEPAARSIGASVNTPIVVHFDRPVQRSSIENGSALTAFGRVSGAASGTYSFSNGDRTVTLSPGTPFSAGEAVMVLLSHDALAVDGSPLRSAGHSFQFWTRARPAALAFTEIDRLDVRTSAALTRSYGAIGTDLNRDGWPDLTVVNEISADLRVFMNRADGTGLYHPVAQPTYPVAAQASPNEPADFNGDGFADICVANVNDNSVSILLGQGNGKYNPQQKVTVGTAPRGIAVLDVDGDGDVDIVNTNAGSANPAMTLLLNNGSGLFGAPVFFPAGVATAWALAAADMNEDGILDLVIGSYDQHRIVVQTGTGAGTFTTVTSVDAVGHVWMVATGDVNGDGHEDVATINHDSATASILLGDGTGGLGIAQVYASDAFGLATDLGDLDGDGDLDWMTASYAGSWRLSLNDGAGAFTFGQQWAATAAGSCSVLLDFDNDRDLDLALIDEVADEVILLRNSGIAPPAPPPGVPGGALATVPLEVDKLDPSGTSLTVSWDTGCAGAADYHILHGTGASLPTTLGGLYGLAGARCGIGTTSPFAWQSTPAPAAGASGWIWFLVVANDTAGTEGSWGRDSAGGERDGPGGGGAANQCHITDKDLTNTCGQ